MMKFKKIITSWLKKVLLISLPVIIIIVIFAGAVYFIKENDGSYLNNVPGNTGSEVEKVLNIMFSNGFAKRDGVWTLDVDFDTVVNDAIQNIEKGGGNIYKYLSKEKAKEYLTAFIKAELVTQYPDLRDDPNKIGTDTAGGHFQGCIQIHRALSDGRTQILTYIDENTFKNYLAANDPNDKTILNHFTIDGTGNIVVPGWKKTTIKYTSTDPNNGTNAENTDYQLTPKEIPYKSLIEKYTMPFDFLWALTVMGEDPEFAYNVAQLAMNSKIVITVLDDVTISLQEEKETYDYETYIQSNASAKITIDKSTSSLFYPERKYENSYKGIGTTKTTRTEECNVKYDITSADVWMVKYEKSYSNQMSGSTMEPPTPQLESTTLSDERVEIGEREETNNAFDRRFEKEVLEHMSIWCGGKKERDKKIDSGAAKWEYIEKYSQKYYEKTNWTKESGTSNSYNAYIPMTSNVTEKTDQFVSLYRNSTTAKKRIWDPVECEWLFEALEKSEKTSDMIELIKYLLYKATEQEGYGITEFDFGIYDTSTFKVISTFGVQLTNYLVQFDNSTPSNSTNKPVSEDLKHQLYYSKVQEAIDGLELTRQQMYALTSVFQDFNCLPTINGKTFKQVYETGMTAYGKNSPEHNLYVWDNWWSELGKNEKYEIYYRDAAFETYVKGTFDFSESDSGEVYNRGCYIYYTKPQLDNFDQAEKNTITRTDANKIEIFTTETPGGTYERSYGDSRVSGYYTSTSGRVFTVLTQRYITGWSHSCNRAAAAIIASGYAEQSADQLISIINGDKAKSGWAVVPGNNYFNLYGLKRDAYEYRYLDVAEYTDIVRNQLTAGGYVMIWINIDGSNEGGNYYGKSGEKWTSLYHWVAIVDYKIENGVEQIMILDWRGGDWYPIDEFQHGIRSYALISGM